MQQKKWQMQIAREQVYLQALSSFYFVKLQPESLISLWGVSLLIGLRLIIVTKRIYRNEKKKQKKRTAYVHSPLWKLLTAIVKLNWLFIYPIEMGGKKGVHYFRAVKLCRNQCGFKCNKTVWRWCPQVIHYGFNYMFVLFSPEEETLWTRRRFYVKPHIPVRWTGTVTQSQNRPWYL